MMSCHVLLCVFMPSTSRLLTWECVLLVMSNEMSQISVMSSFRRTDTTKKIFQTKHNQKTSAASGQSLMGWAGTKILALNGNVCNIL